MCKSNRKITVIYCCDNKLELYRETMNANDNSHGKTVIPEDFSDGKTIVAICEGDVNILNSINDKLVTHF
tara:strand:+ start:173 stop:382 length:210 start_codon:yes stop_codon:yes gene_type:complete